MNKTKKFLISCFIVLNILAMVRIHLPMEKKFIADFYKPIDSYLSFFSVYQSWTMFAPNPSRLNSHLTAEVEFDDGSRDTYFFPDSSKMTLAEKYTNGERYRVIFEAIRRDENSFMWKDAAKFALRKLKDSNFHKIPLKVDMYRHWYEVPDMNKQFIPHLSKAPKFNKYKFYTYEVM